MKHLKRINEEYDNVPVLFEENGVDKISFYPSNMSLDEISKKLHEGSRRKNMVKDFKDNIRDLSDVSDMTLGWALSTINDKKYYSNISRIRFGDENQRYNIK